MASEPKTGKRYYGVPFELINEAAKVHETVHLIINRRNAKGQFAGLGDIPVMKTSELTDIEKWLKDRAGGGTYLVRPVRVDNHAELAEPLCPFEFLIEGPPKPVTAREHGLDYSAGFSTTLPLMMEGEMSQPQPPYPGMPYAIPAPAPQPALQPLPPDVYARLPQFVRELPLQYQWEFAQKMRPEAIDPTATMQLNPNTRYAMPVARHTADEIAMKTADQARTELEKERSEMRGTVEKLTAKLDDMARRLDDERALRQKAEIDAERKVLEAKLQALQQQPQPQKQLDWGEMAKLIAAAAPVVTALIASSKDRSTALAEQQSKAFEMQMKTTATMLEKASAPQPDSTKQLVELGKVVLPLALPFLGDLLKSKGPEAQANLWATMAENQITYMTMIANLTENLAKANAGGGEPWYLPAIQGLLGTGMQVIENLAASQKASFPLGSGQQQAPQLPVGQATPTAQPQQQAPQRQGPTQGQTIAQLVMGHSSFPNELKTQQWFDVLAMLHDGAPIDMVAPRIADLLAELEEAGKIPEALAAAYEQDPRAALGQFIGQLPVAQQRPAYAEAVIDTIIQKLSEMEEPEEGSEETEGAGEVEVAEEPTAPEPTESTPAMVVAPSFGTQPFNVASVMQTKKAARQNASAQ